MHLEATGWFRPHIEIRFKPMPDALYTHQMHNKIGYIYTLKLFQFDEVINHRYSNHKQLAVIDSVVMKVFFSIYLFALFF